MIPILKKFVNTTIGTSNAKAINTIVEEKNNAVINKLDTKSREILNGQKSIIANDYSVIHATDKLIVDTSSPKRVSSGAYQPAKTTVFEYTGKGFLLALSGATKNNNHRLANIIVTIDGIQVLKARLREGRDYHNLSMFGSDAIFSIFRTNYLTGFVNEYGTLFLNKPIYFGESLKIEFEHQAYNSYSGDIEYQINYAYLRRTV